MEQVEQLVLVERRGPVALVTLNRPERRNALSPALLIQLHQSLKELVDKGETRCLVITGTGEKAFSAGYDIGALPASITPEVAELLKENPNPLELGLESIAEFPYPVIAMLNGVAIGAGCELAATCDIRIGAEDIRMGMPPAKLGLVYAPSGMQKFVNHIGLANTKELFLTGRYVDARRALGMGLVNYLLPRAELEAFTLGMAEEIADNAPLAITGMKRLLSMMLQYEELSQAQKDEAGAIIARAFGSEDLREGQLAFMEKRKPVFKGR
jgi:enoyl-CoA hydratase